MRIGEPVIVSVAVRSAPAFAATANWTVPFPEPEAPCVTVRKLPLLTAVQAQLLGVVTEIGADPPEAGNVVVVTPVMIWQPLGPVEGLESLPQAAAETSNAIAERVTRNRRPR